MTLVIVNILLGIWLMELKENVSPNKRGKKLKAYRSEDHSLWKATSSAMLSLNPTDPPGVSLSSILKKTSDKRGPLAGGMGMKR